MARGQKWLDGDNRHFINLIINEALTELDIFIRFNQRAVTVRSSAQLASQIRNQRFLIARVYDVPMERLESLWTALIAADLPAERVPYSPVLSLVEDDAA